LLSGGSNSNCVVKMTQRYFEKLGTDYVGSVVPLCAPFNYDAPGTRVQNYPGALQDLHYVLGLINERASGTDLFSFLNIFPFMKYVLLFSRLY